MTGFDETGTVAAERVAALAREGARRNWDERAR